MPITTVGRTLWETILGAGRTLRSASIRYDFTEDVSLCMLMLLQFERFHNPPKNLEGFIRGSDSSHGFEGYVPGSSFSHRDATIATY